MRNLIYWFICEHGKRKTPRHDDPNTLSNFIAVDISFGTIGYALILSRTFKSVRGWFVVWGEGGFCEATPRISGYWCVYVHACEFWILGKLNIAEREACVKTA